MVKLKSSMFEESKKSTVSDNIFVNIIVFVFVFILIMITESIIPSILSSDEIKQLAASDYGDLSNLIKMTAEMQMKPEFFIPMLLCTVFGTLISILYCRFCEARYLRSMGMKKEKLFRNYFSGALIGLIMMSAIVLIPVFFGIYKISLCSSINFGIIALIFLGFICQGMSEEFIFRGYFMTTLGARHNPYTAVIVSAVAFGLSHCINPGFNLFTFFNLTLFGVFAGLFMIAFDNIWGICAVHSIWNFTQGSLFGIKVSGTDKFETVFRVTPAVSSDLLTGGDFGAEGSIMCTIVLIIGIVLLFLRIKKNESASAE